MSNKLAATGLRRTRALFLLAAVWSVCGWAALRPAQTVGAESSSAPASAAGAARPALAPLGDKTLVAWVYLAETKQRASGVLTVQAGEAFDSLVLGERVPGIWMAGSDFFHRTSSPDAQARLAAETADGQTLVQLAVRYAGRRITLFRNGQRYSEHEVSQAQPFSTDYTVRLGLRYDGSAGQQGFFHGQIEEARLYDRALDDASLAALKPNVLGEPKPLGQWTFEDGTATDAQQHFPRGELCGGARIAGGRLHLNGTDAHVEISLPLPPPRPQAMFFQGRKLGGQWDTWLYYHEGTYYLFILAGPGGNWNGIALATSPDGVRWLDRGLIVRRAEGVTWLGTGATWKSPNFAQDGKFQLNFSEWRGKRQTIFFAESTDLLHWKRLGPEYEFQQDARWYQPQGRWDCIYPLARPGGGLFGYWTADPIGRPGVGFGQSQDGVKWEALEPPQFIDGAPHGECGAVEQIGDKFFMMLGAGGMKTLVAERPQGPFRPAKKNFLLLSGGTYFSRFFPTPQGLLVNHHSIARDRGVFFGPLKKAVVDDEGTLRLKWWEGNEKLKSQPVAVRRPPRTQPVGLLETNFDPLRGVVLEGELTLPAAAAEQPVGLYLEETTDSGTAVRIGQDGIVEFGPLKPDGSGWKMENRVDRETRFGRTARFRLLLKYSLIEFYLDEHLIQCYSLPHAPSGRIGVLRSDAVRELKAWQCED